MKLLVGPVKGFSKNVSKAKRWFLYTLDLSLDNCIVLDEGLSLVLPLKAVLVSTECYLSLTTHLTNMIYWMLLFRYTKEMILLCDVQVIFSGQPQQAPPFRQPTPAQIYSPQTVQGLPQSQAHSQQPAQSSQNPQLVQPPGYNYVPLQPAGGWEYTPGVLYDTGLPRYGADVASTGPIPDTRPAPDIIPGSPRPTSPPASRCQYSISHSYTRAGAALTTPLP